MGWLLLAAALAAAAFCFARWRKRDAERRRAAEARAASLMSEVKAAAAQVDPTSKTQRLLLDAAAKAAEAGEPALAIQLYARLLTRYPESAFAAQARAAVEAQKKSLVKS
jgi:hypothetical protein